MYSSTMCEIAALGVLGVVIRPTIVMDDVAVLVTSSHRQPPNSIIYFSLHIVMQMV